MVWFKMAGHLTSGLFPDPSTKPVIVVCPSLTSLFLDDGNRQPPWVDNMARVSPNTDLFSCFTNGPAVTIGDLQWPVQFGVNSYNIGTVSP